MAIAAPTSTGAIERGTDIDTGITVFTKPSCPQCTATKSTLDRAGVPYTIIDVTQTPEAVDVITAMGYAGLPVVVTPRGHWTGFRPNQLLQAIRDITTAPAVAA